MFTQKGLSLHWLVSSMKYLLLLVSITFLISCGESNLRQSEFERYNKMVGEKIKESCEEVGGTLAVGIEVTYTPFGTDITSGYYCINSKNPVGEIR